MSAHVGKVEKNLAISVVIPALNEADQIDATLSALKRKAGSDNLVTEVIVVDGGSCDDTPTIAKAHGARVIESGQRGRARQMNAGAEAASGDILYFLHADTTPPKNYGQLILHAITGGAGAGCFQLRFDSQHPLLRFYAWCTRFRTTLVRFGDQSLFVTAKDFKKAGGFDENLVVMEDQKIVGNLKKVAPFVVLDEAVVTSARKYRENGAIRLQFIFTMIVLLYYFGANQDTLVHLYQSLIRS